MDPELEEQMRMLEGLNLNTDTKEDLLKPNLGPQETADTLLGNVPFVNPNVNSVAQPFTPENPNNLGVVTNSVVNNTTPISSVIQNQQNMQAAAQVVQPTTSQFVPQAQTVNKPVQNFTHEPSTKPDDIMNQAPVFVNLAASTYQTKTNFLTLKEGEKTRVTLANLQFIRNHIHYIDGLGRVKCLSTYDENDRWPVNRAACCQIPKKDDPSKFENAKNRLLVPVIEYPVSKNDGKTIVQGAKPKLKMWDMNYVEEKSLMDILENYKMGDDWSSIDVSAFDLALSKGKQGEYSTITLVNMPSWRNQFINDINSEINSITQDFYVDAYKESAKTISEDKIIKAINQKQQANQQAQQMANQQFISAQELGIQ